MTGTCTTVQHLKHFDDLDQRGTSSGVALAALEGARFTLKKTPGVLKNGSEL